MPKTKAVTMDASAIIFGAKSIISGMFRKNREDTEIDDSYFMPMLKTCINTVVENSRKAGLPKSGIKTMHDALYQHALDEYVKGWLQNAREDSPDFDEAEEIEDATEKFVAFYEEDEH
jgi:hypothetical protein